MSGPIREVRFLRTVTIEGKRHGKGDTARVPEPVALQLIDTGGAADTGANPAPAARALGMDTQRRRYRGGQMIEVRMNGPETPPPNYASYTDAAARTGLSERTIRDAITRGDLPAFRVGARVLIPHDELDAFVRRNPAARPMTT
jgi:excisionase family DNA binding protein